MNDIDLNKTEGVQGGLPVKKPTTYEEQLELIKKKGFIVDDEKKCIERLKEVNYYRLSAYFLPFKKPDGTYFNGIHFHRIERIYEFDCEFSHILLKCAEKVELYLRSKLAYYSAHKYGALGYMDEKNFSKKHDHENFLTLIDGCIKKHDRTPVVRHHKNKYGGKFPIWVIIEYFTMGMLSYYYSDLKAADQKALAKSMYNTTPSYLQTWLRCVTDLRNCCAHYSRIYYWSFAALPKVPSEVEFKVNRKLFTQVMVLKFLYPEKDKWNSKLLFEIKALINEYGADISLKHIGFPEDWEEKLS